MSYDICPECEMNKYKWRVVLLKNFNVIYKERCGTRLWCYLVGFVWMCIPNSTFSRRRFMVVDA